MNIQRAIGTVRRYGVRGVIDFIRSLPHRHATFRTLKNALIADPAWKPEPGITVIGLLSHASSLSKTLRDFVTRLKECGIPCQAYDTGTDETMPASEYAHLITPKDEFKLNRYTDIVGMFTLPMLPPTGCRLSRIVFWEFESGLCESRPELLEPIEAVSMSAFITDSLRQQIPASTPTSEILYPFTFNPIKTIARDTIRAKYKITADDFVVFFNFSYGSSYYRKNPEGVVRAFAEAFKDRSDAKLVFKTMGAKNYAVSAAKLHALVDSLGLADCVIFIDHFVPQDEIIALTDACDAYISLHRGEGFGLGIAEAMSLAKPVVVTNYSAPTEFCNADNAMLVPYSMRAVQSYEHDHELYSQVWEWAEPDTHVAAKALRRLYDDRAFAKQLGENARRFIADHFSDANFKKSIEAFLARV